MLASGPARPVPAGPRGGHRPAGVRGRAPPGHFSLHYSLGLCYSGSCGFSHPLICPDLAVPYLRRALALLGEEGESFARPSSTPWETRSSAAGTRRRSPRPDGHRVLSRGRPDLRRICQARRLGAHLFQPRQHLVRSLGDHTERTTGRRPSFTTKNLCESEPVKRIPSGMQPCWKISGAHIAGSPAAPPATM